MKTNCQAEKLISEYVANGGKVVVEMAGMPENVLAKQPEFLGVYGEPVSPQGEIEILGKNRRYLLQPFSEDIGDWKSYVPMGLDHVELQFTYYGNEAPLYGYKLVKGKKVWFLGGNLTYHTFQTGDPVASRILKEIFTLSTDYNGEPCIPLTDYQASERGYSMKYRSDHEVSALLPITAIDGMQVKVDGRSRQLDTYENLIRLQLPAGTHTIEILLGKTPIYSWGVCTSFAAMIFLIFGLLVLKRKEVVIK